MWADPLVFVVAALGVLFLWWGAERLYLRRLQRQLDTRILVTGSRGKSSVTRLISAGLNAGGYHSLAKVTGSDTLFIHADGRQEPLNRRRRPNIMEQFGVLRRAVRDEYRVVVVEGMALRPDLQQVEARTFIRPHITVVTNVRPDHLDVMGPTERDVALTFARALAHRTRLFLGDTEFVRMFTIATASLQCPLYYPARDPFPKETLERFTYMEHPDNVSVALSVCTALGIERDRALAGMVDSRPDAGGLEVVRCQIGETRIFYIHALAANDPESVEQIQNLPQIQRYLDSTPLILLLVTRPDRHQRTLCLLKRIDGDQVSQLLWMGSRLPLLDRHRVAKMIPGHPTPLFTPTIRHLDETLRRCPYSECCVLGIGNMGGLAGDILAYFDDHRIP
jgi:poly-gamma-glutamate synthase PgsB/CapB